VDGAARLEDMGDLRPSDDRRARRLRDELAGIDFVLPGSLVERRMRCGNPNCRCRADPPELHGPYLQWTRRGAHGKTVTRYLSAEQVERYQPWFDNARRLRSLVSELEELSLRIVERAEGWEPRP
jgi:hypothetical protein